MSVQVTTENEQVVVTTNAENSNVVLTPDQTTVEIVADANQVCVASDQTSVEITPQTQIVAVTASSEPVQPVAVEAGGQVAVTVAETGGIQGPPGPSSTVTFPAPEEMDDADPTYLYVGWPVYPNPGDSWLIRRVNRRGAPQRRKATVENNPGYLNLSQAWSDRQNLNYEAG